MSFAVVSSAAGQDSIRDQIIWYETEVANGGDELADRWHDRLLAALHTLSRNPQRYGFAPENGEWLPELKIRQMLFRPWKSGVGWRVLYAIDEEAKLVTILQVRHEHRRGMHDCEVGDE